NYPAVLAWLKTGPKTMPPNLRAGRILFYTQIPSDCTTPANQDEWFWREYIDYVLGVQANRACYNATYCLAGTEVFLSDTWATKFLLTATSGFKPTGAINTNPKPYMCYTDVPNMPRAKFFFGPASLSACPAPRPRFTGAATDN